MLVYYIFENDELIWARNYPIENEKEGIEKNKGNLQRY